jgi:hypothetical protein
MLFDLVQHLIVIVHRGQRGTVLRSKNSLSLNGSMAVIRFGLC